MEWISIEDRLPEEETLVLFGGIPYKTRGFGFFVGFLSEGSFCFHDDTFDWHFIPKDFPDSKDEYYDGDTTHWMPLPSPPDNK